MIIATIDKPYSAEVTLTLHVNGLEYAVSKTGPERVVLRQAVNLPPCDAELSICIDGNVSRQKIRLPNGASDETPMVATARCRNR